MSSDSNEETALMNSTVLAVQKEFGSRVRLWRQNAGQAWSKPAFHAHRAADVLRRYKSGAIGEQTAMQLLLGCMASHPIKLAIAGAADVAGILGPDGRRIELEFKVGRGRQSKEQQAYQRMIEGLGGAYGIIRDESDAISMIKDRCP
jgi:hypothetical protein